MKKITLNLEDPFLNLNLRKEESPFVIAGPCSAESEEQVLLTAKQLKEIPQVKVFRCGIWKPRTRPNSFEGIGVTGLKWLNSIQKDFHLPVAIEVACPQHAEEALKYGIDILWLGARTVVNPFIVQEIANVLKGSPHVPVLVKNPINADLSLWIGALERLNDVGIKKLCAVHRGFSTMEQSLYRYPPTWKIPFELKRLIPELPVICDPSHICGKRELLPLISQMALDLDFSGLMIETHPQPHQALSDSEQQITPADLSTLISRLIIKKSCLILQEKGEDQINDLRKKIDKIDYQIIDFLHQRKKIVEEMAVTKKENKMTILQIERLKQMVIERVSWAKEMQISEKYIEDLFALIHEESVRIQQR